MAHFPDVHKRLTYYGETPRKVRTVKRDGLKITVEVYGEPSEQAIKNFNRIFHDALDEKEKRDNTASA